MRRPHSFLFFIIVGIECIALIVIGRFLLFRYLSYQKTEPIPIRRYQITIPAGNILKHFYTYKPNQSLLYTASFMKGVVSNKTNADGLVDRFDYIVPKPEGVFRIIAVGDSFTQGIFVKTEDSFPELAEELLSQTSGLTPHRIEVLNLGVGGYDIEYAAERLRLIGMKYDPDLVVWVQKFDDYYLINEQMLGARGSLADELLSAGIPNVSEELEKYLTLPYRLREESVKQRAIKSAFDYQKSRFMAVREFYRGPILIITLDDNDPLLSDMIVSLQSLDRSVYSFQIQDEIARLPDAHPNEDGHKVIANAVVSWVTQYLMSPKNN